MFVSVRQKVNTFVCLDLQCFIACICNVKVNAGWQKIVGDNFINRTDTCSKKIPWYWSEWVHRCLLIGCLSLNYSFLMQRTLTVFFNTKNDLKQSILTLRCTCMQSIWICIAVLLFWLIMFGSSLFQWESNKLLLILHLGSHIC